MFNPCVIIPLYNHPRTIAASVAKIRALQLHVIIVDDGSEPDCHRLLEQIAASNSKVTLLTRAHNGGKGAAVKSGLALAETMKFSHALQVDADGQHDLGDIPRFLDIARIAPTAIVSGRPRYDDSVPKSRLYSRYLTHVWVWINTLSLTIADSMCGFRVYPVAACCALIRSTPLGNRMDFDIEILVKWYWQGGDILQPTTPVHYPTNSVSHFHGVRDTLLISKMHATLFFGMLARLPQLLRRHRSRRSTEQPL